jgi:biotin carboxyl carrier protein
MAAAQTRPRFRTDLVAQSLELEGHRFVDVTDPESESTFRFYEVEYSLACAMDGNRDVQGLAQWAEEELGLRPEPSEIETVINTLAELGYLRDQRGSDDLVELGAPGAAARHSAERNGQGNGSAGVQLGAAGAAQPSPGKLESAPESRVSRMWDAPVDLPPATPVAVPETRVSKMWDAADSDIDFGSLLGNKPAPPASESASLLEPASAPEPEPELSSDGVRLESATPIADEVTSPGGSDDDVSVDLSDHLSIDTDDVKEAVRQSKVMQAVDVPRDLLDQLDQETSAKPVATPPPMAEPEEVPPAPRPAAPAPTPLVVTSPPAALARPVELPERPASVAEGRDDSGQLADHPAAVAVPAPVEDKRWSVGWLILLALLFGAAAFGAAWYLELFAAPAQPASTETTEAPLQNTPEPTAAEAMAPVPLKVASAAETEVAATADGVIATIADAGDEIQEGGVLAQLGGAEAVERNLVRPRRKLKEYSDKLAEAEAEGDAKAIAALRRKVAEKRQKIAAGEDALAALTILAPIKGTVRPVVEVGAQVKKGQAIAHIAGKLALKATFPAPRGEAYEPGAQCEVGAAQAAGKVVPCTVAAVEDGLVTVRVEEGMGLSAGDPVVLK